MIIKSVKEYQIEMDGHEFHALYRLIGRTSPGIRHDPGLTDSEDHIIANIYIAMSNHEEGK